MQDSIKNLKQFTAFVLILFWLGWHLALPVDLIISDLGRHLKNGELLLQGNWDVLYKNFYSYTNPDYPFINHHWLFGVFCFVCWHYLGFAGLSFIYLMIQLLTFYVFLCCWQRYSSLAMVCAFGLLSFPLISLRSEIRPEGISYLFCGLFFWLIDSFGQKRLKSQHLIITLCLLQVIWVNTHIFFIIGPILTAIFWWQAHSTKQEEQAGVLQKLFFFLLGMCLINPSGINGLLAPFHVDKAYSFPIIENYPVYLLVKLKLLPFRPALLYFLAALAMLCTALFFLIKREGFRNYILIGSLTLILSLAAMKAMRMIGLFGYFWIPLSTYAYSRWLHTKTVRIRKNIEILLLALGIIVSASVNFNWNQGHFLGIIPGSNDAAEFFKREKISGAIFNNYDIGGYLIFHLSPQNKLFVDDRMEAYPEDFLKRTYIQMQWDDGLWHKLDQKYHFNVIFISIEQSNWGTRFLLHRFEDPAWAPVFVNGKTIILLRRNAQNAQIIRRNEVLADMIQVIPSYDGSSTRVIMTSKAGVKQ